MTTSVKRRGPFVEWEIVGHLPREISRFCHYFVNYGGALEGRVRDRKYRASPIPSHGLEIPITLVIKLHDAEEHIFQKMKDLVLEYYTEPDSIPTASGHNEGGDGGSDIDADLYFEQFEPPENEDVETNIILIDDEDVEEILAIDDDSDSEI